MRAGCHIAVAAGKCALDSPGVRAGREGGGGGAMNGSSRAEQTGPAGPRGLQARLAGRHSAAVGSLMACLAGVIRPARRRRFAFLSDKYRYTGPAAA